ncbi:unnamed protein product [Periconia digitata]|uniref:Stress-associated endoplasmic reticulum protein n=1 Tax=Periconia digitata TaxID=1303443 RepID=A0A9W4UVH1_9PLEO|nr:unnamed protein product [Periconia digitata]
MAQTPQQRAANAKFAKREEAKMGRPSDFRARKETFSSPISKGWVSKFFPINLPCSIPLRKRPTQLCM